MATPTSIIAGIITAIEALTPKGGTTVGIESAYKHTADDMPEGAETSWADRQFRISPLIPRAVDRMYGTLATVDYEGALDIEISHVIGPWQASAKRCAEDIHQIIDQMQRLGTFTALAGVSQIRLDEPPDQSMTTEEDFWITRLRFRVNYSLTADYGGA